MSEKILGEAALKLAGTARHEVGQVARRMFEETGERAASLPSPVDAVSAKRVIKGSIPALADGSRLPQVGSTLREQMAALQSPDPVVRRQGMTSIWAKPHTRVLKAVLHALEHDPDPGVRSQAALALGSFSDQRSWQALQRAQRSEDHETRVLATVALIRRLVRD